MHHTAPRSHIGSARASAARFARSRALLNRFRSSDGRKWSRLDHRLRRGRLAGRSRLDRVHVAGNRRDGSLSAATLSRRHSRITHRVNQYIRHAMMRAAAIGAERVRQHLFNRRASTDCDRKASWWRSTPRGPSAQGVGPAPWGIATGPDPNRDRVNRPGLR